MRFTLSIISSVILTIAINAQTVKVTHVSDGDSFIIATGDRVRMIGINSPELADKFGPESKEHLARLIRGKSVKLERDPQNDDRDIHGRLLRFVSLDGTDINLRMIADGYAYAFLRYPFEMARREAYRDAEKSASSARVGLWSQSVNDDVNSAPGTTPSTPANTPESNGASEGEGPRTCCAALALVILSFVFGFRFRRRSRSRDAFDANLT